MTKSFIFPGQASQYVGMAADLYDKYDLAKEYFDRANDIMQLDLKEICFNGPEEKLKQTYITQPAIFVHSCIIAALLKEKGILPAAVAGHSLGEYSALVAAEVFNFDTGLKLVKERSRLMHEAGQKNPGTMGAVIGMEPDQVKEVCNELASAGIIQPANFNCPGQIAVSGDKETVLKSLAIFTEKGARKAVELVVSGAFHSPLMKDAQQGMATVLETAEMRDAVIPVYTNVTSKAVTNGSELKKLLLEQITSPVLWQDSISNMISDSISSFVEVGPGSVLKGLLRRIDRNASCITCGTVQDIESFEA